MGLETQFPQCSEQGLEKPPVARQTGWESEAPAETLTWPPAGCSAATGQLCSLGQEPCSRALGNERAVHGEPEDRARRLDPGEAPSG